MLKEGTAIFLIKDNRFLAGLRKNTTHFANYIGLPGGKKEADETFTMCIIRETYEETGIKLTAISPVVGQPILYKEVDFSSKDAGKSGFDILCQWYYAFVDHVPETNPEGKEWQWFDMHNPPDNLMPGTKDMLKEVIRKLQRRNENML